MAILLTTKSRGRFFLKGDGFPVLCSLREEPGFCQLTDFLNVPIRIKISEIESMTQIEDRDVKELYSKMKAASSPLVTH